MLIAASRSIERTGETFSALVGPLRTIKKIAGGIFSLLATPVAFLNSPFTGWAQIAHGTSQLGTGAIGAATHLASAGQTAAKLAKGEAVSLKEGTNLSVIATLATGAALTALNPVWAGATAVYFLTSKTLIIPFAIAWGLI